MCILSVHTLKFLSGSGLPSSLYYFTFSIGQDFGSDLPLSLGPLFLEWNYEEGYFSLSCLEGPISA